jgi:hypothetical protein
MSMRQPLLACLGAADAPAAKKASAHAEPGVGFGDVAIDRRSMAPWCVARGPLLRRFHQCFEFAARNDRNHHRFCDDPRGTRHRTNCLYGQIAWCLRDAHSIIEFTSDREWVERI